MEIGREKVRKAGPAEPGRTRKKVCMFTRTSAHRFLVALIVSTTAAVVLAAITWHSGPTFTQNAGSDGTLNTIDDTFTITGDGSGQGNTRLTATITLSGTVRYTCRNQGGNEAPGQNPVPATTTGSQDVKPTNHNGRSIVNLTVGPLTASPTIGGKVAGCPNGNWSGVNPVFEGPRTATVSITFGGAQIYTNTIDYSGTP
jgi:hypothetical protein